MRDCERSSSSDGKARVGRGVRHPKRAGSGMKEDSVVVSARERRVRKVGSRRGEGRWQTFRAREDKVDAGWLRGWKKDEGRRREQSRSSRADSRQRGKKKELARDERESERRREGAGVGG